MFVKGAQYGFADRLVRRAAPVPHPGCTGPRVVGHVDKLRALPIFAFSAVSHLAPMKKDLIAMVPPALPRPDVVLVTGIMELAAAAGLLFEATRFWAAWGLMLLLMRYFRQTLSAARRGVGARW